VQRISQPLSRLQTGRLLPSTRCEFYKSPKALGLSRACHSLLIAAVAEEAREESMSRIPSRARAEFLGVNPLSRVGEGNAPGPTAESNRGTRRTRRWNAAVHRTAIGGARPVVACLGFAQRAHARVRRSCLRRVRSCVTDVGHRAGRIDVVVGAGNRIRTLELARGGRCTNPIARRAAADRSGWQIHARSALGTNDWTSWTLRPVGVCRAGRAGRSEATGAKRR
jgi:hypothetical protein